MKSILEVLTSIDFELKENVIKTAIKNDTQLLIRKVNNTKYCYNIFVFKNDSLYCDYDCLNLKEAIKTIKVFI